LPGCSRFPNSRHLAIRGLHCVLKGRPCCAIQLHTLPCFNPLQYGRFLRHPQQARVTGATRVMFVAVVRRAIMHSRGKCMASAGMHTGREMRERRERVGLGFCFKVSKVAHDACGLTVQFRNRYTCNKPASTIAFSVVRKERAWATMARLSPRAFSTQPRKPRCSYRRGGSGVPQRRGRNGGRYADIKASAMGTGRVGKGGDGARQSGPVHHVEARKKRYIGRIPHYRVVSGHSVA